MPKNSNEQIKQDEKRIIKELRKYANKSINDIAKSCHFSRQKVWRIIKNLEKNNTIWGYTAVIDEQKLGEKSFILLIKRKQAPIKEETVDKVIDRDIENKIKELGVEIIYSLYTNGIYDWIEFFSAPDTKTAKKFVENFNILYGDYISENHLIETMFSVKSNGIKNPELEKFKDMFNF